MDPTPLGNIVEGLVERDPLTDRLQIMTVDESGRAKVVNVEELVASFLGKEVRLTLASFENLARLSQMVEDQEGLIGAVMPEQFPEVSFNIVRKGS